ncbi:MAG: hypothetical protein AAF541_16425 [Pseudomonadota bacterium]
MTRSPTQSNDCSEDHSKGKQVDESDLTDQSPAYGVDQHDEPNQYLDASNGRLGLVWQVLIFQLKLAADGLRDLILVPVSMIAALAGLLTSRDDPAKYFRRILLLGRQSEYWINLFGYRRGQGTADEMLKPLEDRFLTEAQNNPHLKRAGDTVNRSLDRSIDSINNASKRDSDLT